jgi:hypothetical protein
MFVTPEFPSENPRIQNRNYPYTKTLCAIKKKTKINDKKN